MSLAQFDQIALDADTSASLEAVQVDSVLPLRKHAETYRCIALSTGHVKAVWWDIIKHLSEKHSFVFLRDEGVFIKLFNEFASDLIQNAEDIANASGVEKEEVQHFASLISTLFWAGYGLVEFDCDAQVSDVLEVFDNEI